MQRWNCEVPEPRKASIAKDMVCDEPSLRLLYTTPESLQTPKLLESLKVTAGSHAQPVVADCCGTQMAT